MSIWFVLAVGMTLQGEPAAQSLAAGASKTACEQVRMKFDEYMQKQGTMASYSSQCVEMKIPEKS